MTGPPEALFPEKVMLQTVSRCNAACAFCPYPVVSRELPQGEMEQPLFERIIDECAEHPGAVQRLLPYLMNEPLLDRRLVARINYAKRRLPWASVHILTNGSLLTERRGEELIDSGLDWIGISVHGFSEEAYHGAMGLSREVTYRRVERFVDRALARRGPGFVMLTFNGGGPVTAQEREAALEHFRGLGVRRISYFGGSISRAGNVSGIEAPRHAEIRGCRSIWWPEMIHVLFNGDVVLCCMDWRRRVVVGNLSRAMSIADLWRSDAYRSVRDTVWGRRPLPDDMEWPCSRCEEAIVEPVETLVPVDVALVVLPCAVLDGDASAVPGLQQAVHAFGLDETMLDLSIQIYRRMDDEHTFLWRRAGHGVVHQGDPSAEVVRELPDEVEWCVERVREIPAHHIVLPLMRATRRFTLEVVRRVREREPERSLLVFGEDEERPELLASLGVPYHFYRQREETAEWIARQAGRLPAPPSPPRENDERPPSRPEPPWRPPGWEGTGAGMVRPAPDELRRGPLGRWLESVARSAREIGRIWRHPVSSTAELARQARLGLDSLGDAVAGMRRRADGDSADLSGTPGSMDLAPLAAVRVKRSRVEPSPSPAPPPPPDRSAPDAPESPWQRRPDEGEPIDVLLGTLPPWGFNNPPVGLAHLATYARSRGYRVEVLDMNIDLYHRLGPEWHLLWHVENKSYWSDEKTFDLLLELLSPHLDRYARIIAEHPAPLVGLSVVDPKERCTIELVRRVRELAPGKRVLLGGPACVTADYRRIFTDNIPELVDGYAMGEGEETLCEVIEAVRAGATDLSGIPGVLRHEGGRDLPYKRRKRLLPLDRVPFPGYEDFDPARYPGDELIVEWSRGCIGSCAFCKGKMIDGRYRSHSARTIFDSLRRYVDELGVRKFTVCDPVINGEPGVLAELSQLIVESGMEIEWRGEAIPHSGLTEDLLRAMRAAGCVELQLGLESGSDRVLERMNKGRLFSAAEAAAVVRGCHAAGIRTALFIIIGFPGEGEAEFEETFRFVAENAEHIDELKSINSLHVITDTPIHAHPERFNLCLPEIDYHYLWSTTDGENTIEVRNSRIRRLLALAEERGIHVRETNLAEGKHRDLARELVEDGRGRAEMLAALRRQVTELQSYG